eukprot:TRINITY_DN8727_c0_g4_i7.p1 TRINITY_DN8727_c0_g4~~TRINITY_DN8727_c0_g4_i7.p1  ORF type:complete len:281 (-),score=11.77 TRINITY_DN8727_c0_g4_i7:19-861(-)
MTESNIEAESEQWNDALCRGDLEHLRALHQFNPVLPKFTPHAFSQACKFGSLPLVEWFIEHIGFSVSTLDESGYAPLYLAAERGDLGLVQAFVERWHANVHQLSHNGLTALHGAAAGGHLEIVVYLVKHGCRNLHTTDLDALTPLHLAAKQGHLEVVEYLVEHAHASVNASHQSGLLPIHCAALGGHHHVIQYLLSRGAQLPCHTRVVDIRCVYGLLRRYHIREHYRMSFSLTKFTEELDFPDCLHNEIAVYLHSHRHIFETVRKVNVLLQQLRKIQNKR